MKYAEYEQQLKYLPFKLDKLEDILRARPIDRWAYLIHDKDKKGDALKEPHIHVMMDLHSDQTAENVAKWFGDTPEHIQKARYENGTSKRKAYENMCSYLIHDIGNKEGDYHYDPTEPKANFDYVQFIEKIRSEVKDVKENANAEKIFVRSILEKICNNEIPRLKIDNYLTNLQRIKYDKDIKKAYEIRDERLQREVDRDMNVMYFTGDSGTGKTTMAKFMASQKHYDIFVTGSSNDPLQGYIGQECIILDDMRGSDWKINDLLKFLDNNTNSLVKSRYSNKLLNDCKLIIITSVQDIDTLYKTLKETEHEPIKQLKRRCADYVKFTNSTMSMYHYNEKRGDYDHIQDLPNMTSQIIFMKEHTSLLEDLKNTVETLKNEPF